MKSFKDFNESGLWDNIRKKRARGEPMRKKGEKGAPTAAAMAKAKGESYTAPVDESINVKKALAKVKGITKQQTQMFMSLPTPLLQNIIQQLSALTMSNEEVNEAPYVAGEMDIIDSMWNEIRNKMFKDKRNKKMEKHWPFIQVLAKYAGFKVTKKGQDRDKIFRFDAKK
jgi:hypothetical protein